MRINLKVLATPAKSKFLDRALDEVAICLAAVSFVLLLVATHGLDLSPGLF